MNGVSITDALRQPVIKLIAQTAQEENLEVFLIGGYVRDLFLKRPVKDIDIMVLGSGILFAQKVAARLGAEKHVHIFENFGTAMIRHDAYEIEFVGARKESYRKDSRKPLVEDGSLSDDQNRRDFTINAMAVSLSKSRFGELLDPFNGMNDLQQKIIRTPLDPDITFSDDPLRMMRAVRFSAQLGFSLHPDVFTSIRSRAERINIVSRERVSDELNKIILSDDPAGGLKLLADSGLLKFILPWLEALKGVEIVEKVGHKDNFHHTLQVLSNIAEKSNDLWLRWAAILHDIAKPQTKKFTEGIGWTFHGHEIRGSRMAVQIFRELRLPMNEKLRYVQKLISLHLRPARLTEEGVTDSAVRRLLFEAGKEIDDLMLLAEADITSKNQTKVRNFLKNFSLLREKLTEVEEKDRLRNWQPPVSGELIMETFGLTPCREVGIIKTAIREAILEGEIPNDFEQAYQFMLEEGKKLGLQKK